jgi:hypothetical protein
MFYRNEAMRGLTREPIRKTVTGELPAFPIIRLLDQDIPGD